MVEVEQHRIAVGIVAHLLHRTGVMAPAIRRGEFNHITNLILRIGVAPLQQQLARNPLHHGGIALAESLASGNIERGTHTLVQSEQALFHGRGQLAGPERERGRLACKGVDDVACRAGEAVMQSQEGARLNLGRSLCRLSHESPDKLGSIVETSTNASPVPAEAPSTGTGLAAHLPAMPLKDLPPDARPREKLLARGPGALSDAELLALLLRTGIQGKGVLQLAQELLEIKTGFDGVAGLLHASADDLKRVKGLGPAKRAELVAVLELARRALAQQLREREGFDSPGAVKHYLQLQLAARPHEVFAVLFLDAQNRLLALEELFRGTLTQTSVYPREVVLRALHHQAASVVLAHNHPSGSVEPSRADEALTQTLKAALALVDVRVLDHVIVGTGQALSMAERGLL